MIMRKLRLYFLILPLALSLALPTTLAQRKDGRAKTNSTATVLAARGVETISANQMRSYLTFIASDEMEGRDTPSRGLDTTAKFIAMNLGRWSFKPMGDDGTFFQKIALRREALDPTKTSASINGKDFVVGDDFLPNAVSAMLSGPLIYAGNGWVLKSKNLTPYQGIDVKDKIIVVVGTGFPRGVTRNDLAGRMGEDWSSPTVYAQQHGAKGVLAIPDAGALLSWEQLRARSLQPPHSVVEKFTTQPNAPPIPNVVMSIKMAKALFEGEKVDAVALANGSDVAPFELTPKNITVTIAVKSEH